MTIPLPRFLDASSPSMLILSVSLHGFLILAIVLASSLLPSRPKSIEDGVSHVKLVEPNEGAVVLEKVQRGPVKTGDLESAEPYTNSDVQNEVSDTQRDTLELKVANSHSTDVIPFQKRKKPLERVDALKPLPKKNQEVEAVKKKPDPQDFLEKRLASIRKEVESRKTDTSSSAPSRDPATSPALGNHGSKHGAQSTSEDSARWFDGVRTRINSNWSVFRDTIKLERFTIIGVKIAEDGRLVDASVDESSGDPVFDRSAIRAIFQASPFPPMPPEVSEKIRKAGGLALRFTPSGLQ